MAFTAENAADRDLAVVATVKARPSDALRRQSSMGIGIPRGADSPPLFSAVGRVSAWAGQIWVRCLDADAGRSNEAVLPWGHRQESAGTAGCVTSRWGVD